MEREAGGALALAADEHDGGSSADESDIDGTYGDNADELARGDGGGGGGGDEGGNDSDSTDESSSAEEMRRLLHAEGSVVMVYVLMKPKWSRASHHSAVRDLLLTARGH